MSLSKSNKYDNNIEVISIGKYSKIHENDKIAYKQFGNTVNIKVIEKIIDIVFNAYKIV